MGRGRGDCLWRWGVHATVRKGVFKVGGRGQTKTRSIAVVMVLLDDADVVHCDFVWWQIGGGGMFGWTG